MSFRLRPEAKADIEGIARHIAGDNPPAARRWIEDTYRHCRRLGEMPGMGATRFDVRHGLRLFPAGNYLILYREIDDGAEIVRVIHGARQWQDLL
ncbi:MAG: type II toxin-antitoxin system RelE/ParE family toxin [Parvibaculaceae bacterium]